MQTKWQALTFSEEWRQARRCPCNREDKRCEFNWRDPQNSASCRCSCACCEDQNGKANCNVFDSVIIDVLPTNTDLPTTSAHESNNKGSMHICTIDLADMVKKETMHVSRQQLDARALKGRNARSEMLLQQPQMIPGSTEHPKKKNPCRPESVWVCQLLLLSFNQKAWAWNREQCFQRKLLMWDDHLNKLPPPSHHRRWT